MGGLQRIFSKRHVILLVLLLAVPALAFQYFRGPLVNIAADWTASRLLATVADGTNEKMVTVSDLTTYIAGTTGQVAVANDGDGTATLSLAIAADGLVTRTAATTYASRTITGTANQITVTNGDGVAGNPTLSLPTNLSGVEKHLRFTLWDPATMYAKDTRVCIVPKLDAAIHVISLEVTCDGNPATEPTGDLKYADTFIGLANPAVIQAFDTTAGVFSSGAINVAVASGKAIYVQFDAAADAAITQMSFDVTFKRD